MNIQLYNTLTRKKEIFEPLKEGEVSMYNCGPTVYDTPHIGNYRTFVMNDIIRRVFEYNGYKVTQAMNITDVDDKTIKRSTEQKIPLIDLTRKYEDLFLAELESLNIKRPHHILRATENTSSMIELISTLIEKGSAYIAEDGVYISIEKIKDYGQLANISLKNESRERVANDEYDKDNPRDFAIWKFSANDTGETAKSTFDAPFGKGRPGWHIECSAMSMHVFGPTLDIHTGGSDLIFPHHTNEIAQSESATGIKFVKYWLHGGFMNVSDEKMAKSKGNFLKLSDLIDNTISALSFRYWLLTAHYHAPVNFTLEAVNAGQNALIKLIRTLGEWPDEEGVIIREYKDRFLRCINDDFNLPSAIGVVWEMLKDQKISNKDKRSTLLDFDQVLGLNLASVPKLEEEIIPDEIQALATARESARNDKDWAKADALRKEITDRGYEVLDTDTGSKLRSL